MAGLAVAVNATLGAPRPPASSFSPSLRTNIPVTTSGPHPIPGGYQVSSAYTVSAPVLALEVYGGTVTVTGSQRSTISVSEHVKYFGSGSRPAMVRNLTGQKVTLEYECSGKPLCAVSYDIQVPRGIAVLVDSDRGDIRLSSLAGGVEATSGTGTITANGLSSPEAAFLAVGGSVNAVFTAVPTTVPAASAGGDITIRVPGTVSYQVNIRPGNGKATVSVPQSFSSRHLIAANSNQGDVTVASSS